MILIPAGWCWYADLRTTSNIDSVTGGTQFKQDRSCGSIYIFPEHKTCSGIAGKQVLSHKTAHLPKEDILVVSMEWTKWRVMRSWLRAVGKASEENLINFASTGCYAACLRYEARYLWRTIVRKCVYLQEVVIVLISIKISIKLKTDSRWWLKTEESRRWSRTVSGFAPCEVGEWYQLQ